MIIIYFFHFRGIKYFNSHESCVIYKFLDIKIKTEEPGNGVLTTNGKAQWEGEIQWNFSDSRYSFSKWKIRLGVKEVTVVEVGEGTG